MRQRDAFLKRIYRFGGVLVEFLAVFRELDFAALAFEEGDTELSLELRYGIGKRRLRNEQFLRGMGVVLHFGELAEVIQLREIHAIPFNGLLSCV